MPGGIPTSQRPTLDGLTGIRALAAGWVVVEHFRLIIFALLPATVDLTPWIRSGFLGVEVFFVLSGFIISYQWADRFTVFSGAQYRKFIYKRFARIYPMQFVTLVSLGAIVLVAMGAGIALSGIANYTVGNFVGNLFNLQALPGIASFNNPAWSISVEFAAYLVFPLIALGLVGVKSARRGFLAAASLSATGVAAMMFVAMTVDDSPTGEAMIWLRIATEFTVGCLLYAGWRHLEERQFGVHWDWVAGGATILLAAVLGFTGGEGAGALVTVPIIALFVLSCAGATGPIGRLLSSRLMMWGGRVSYSVYMTHFIVLMVLGEVLPPTSFQGTSLVVRVSVVVFYLVVSVVIGAAGYHLIEEPARKWLTRANKRGIPAASLTR